MSEPVVSVVVAARDGEGYVPTLLGALDAQTLPPDAFEVVVVDDGSVDSTPDLLATWVQAAPERRRLVRGRGQGPARARNLGVDAARGEWIAFTDIDTKPSRDWLERALEALERTGASALEGGVDGDEPGVGGPFAHQIGNIDSPGRYMTANMIYRRALLQELGGFDERFGQAYLEDSDLAFRVLDRGHEIPFAPEAVVHHPVVRGNVRSVLRSARQVRWIALLASNHPERYRSELRPFVRPLSSNDVDVLVGMLAICGLAGSRGPGRLAMLPIAAKGIKQAFGAGRVLAGPRSEATERAFLSLALPVLKGAWWLEGCARFRTLIW